MENKDIDAGLPFVLALAEHLGVKPKDFVKAIINQKKNPKYLKEFTIVFAELSMKEMLENIEKNK